MMNKCAKFHKDSPSDKKVKFNLPSVIELSETAVLCTTLYRNLMQASNFGDIFDQLFLWNFLWNFHRRCLSTSSIPRCKKVKWPKPQIKGGGLPKYPSVLLLRLTSFLLICIALLSLPLGVGECQQQLQPSIPSKLEKCGATPVHTHSSYYTKEFTFFAKQPRRPHLRFRLLLPPQVLASSSPKTSWAGPDHHSPIRQTKHSSRITMCLRRTVSQSMPDDIL